MPLIFFKLGRGWKRCTVARSREGRQGKMAQGSSHFFNGPFCLLNGISGCWWITVLVNFQESLETILFSWTRSKEEITWIIFNRGLVTTVQLWWKKCSLLSPLSENFLTQWCPNLGDSLSYTDLVPKLTLFLVQHILKTATGNLGCLWGWWEKTVRPGLS